MARSPIHLLSNLLARDNGDRTYTLTTEPSADQDPVHDHANGQASSVTASEMILTPQAGHTFAEITAAADVWIRTDGAAAAVPTDAMTGGVPILIAAGQPRIVPVTPTVAVRAISASGAAVLVTAVPMKARAE